MNSRTFTTLVLLCVLAAASAVADTLASLDARARLLTVNSAAGLKAYRLKDTVEVRVDGVAGRLDQLQSGMQLTLGFADPQTVSRINALTAIANPPIGLATSGNVQRSITVKVKVDGKDLVKVKDGKVTVEHKAWNKPSEISINGRRWKTQWNGDVSDEFINFAPPLAPFTGAPIVVKKTKGRGSATLKQAPTTENQQTLIVEINDATENGADLYEVRISW